MGDVKRIGVRMVLNQPYKRHVSVYSGILQYAKQHPDWRLFVDEWIDKSLPARRGAAVPYDGIIGRIEKPAGDRARRLDLPAVNVMLSSPAKGLPGVFVDNVACGRLAADHLLGRGFRCLAALVRKHDKGTALQAAAMKARAEEHGFGEGWLGTEAVESVDEYDAWQEGIATIKRWMAMWQVPMGLLVSDPAWARVVVQFAGEHGWHVPQQIAIVCANNDDYHCEAAEPGLSAVENPDEEIGSKAAELLDGLIDAKRNGKSPYANPQTVILPPVGVVARLSTDFFAVADPLVAKALRHIAAHLHRPLSPGSVARAIGVGRRTLDGWFQDALGVTVATEIIRLRLERVKRELTSTTDTLDVIARRTGFASTRTLNHQFKQSTGMAPSEFREHGNAKR